jgi:D-3-phosphoglycerate dehydrogenase
MRPKVVITDSSYPDSSFEREELAAVDATVETIDAETPEEVIERAAGADALLNQEVELPDSVFEALDDLVVVGRYGVGLDNIDLDAAAEHDVEVVNVPSYCEEEVATHALSLLLACVRHIVQYDTQVKQGGWDWKAGRPIRRLSGNTLGFVAFGRIAQRFATLLDGFDMECIAYDPYQSASVFEEYGVESVSFETLLDRADIVSIHTPLTEETRDLFDAETFSRMNDEAILINVARGGVVDAQALADALQSGAIAGAGLDVLPEEPPRDSPLFDRNDVVITPHTAWYSEDSMEELRRTVARDLARTLNGESPENGVNER